MHLALAFLDLVLPLLHNLKLDGSMSVFHLSSSSLFLFDPFFCLYSPTDRGSIFAGVIRNLRELKHGNCGAWERLFLSCCFAASAICCSLSGLAPCYGNGSSQV